VTDPSPTTVTGGNTATFTVVAAGDSISYRWQKGGVNISNGATGNGSTYSGVLTSTLSIASAKNADAGNYRCVVSNGVGPDATRAAAALSLQFTLTTNLVNVGTSGAILGVSPAPNTAPNLYNAGTVVTLTVTANAPYDVASWTGSSSIANPLVITMTDNTNLTGNIDLRTSLLMTFKLSTEADRRFVPVERLYSPQGLMEQVPVAIGRRISAVDTLVNFPLVHPFMDLLEPRMRQLSLLPTLSMPVPTTSMRVGPPPRLVEIAAPMLRSARIIMQVLLKFA